MAERDDTVDRIDRKLHRILMRIAESTADDSVRMRALDLTLTMPAVREWPAERVAELHEWASLAAARIAASRNSRNSCL